MDERRLAGAVASEDRPHLGRTESHGEVPAQDAAGHGERDAFARKHQRCRPSSNSIAGTPIKRGEDADRQLLGRPDRASDRIRDREKRRAEQHGERQQRAMVGDAPEPDRVRRNQADEADRAGRDYRGDCCDRGRDEREHLKRRDRDAERACLQIAQCEQIQLHGRGHAENQQRAEHDGCGKTAFGLGQVTHQPEEHALHLCVRCKHERQS